MNKKSSVPLIMGIIAAVLLVPGMLCVACAGAAVDIAGGGTGDNGAVVGYILSIAAIAASIIGGAYGKKDATISGIVLLIAAILTTVGWIMTAFLSFFHLVALVLLIIGCIFGFLNKGKE